VAACCEQGHMKGWKEFADQFINSHLLKKNPSF